MSRSSFSPEDVLPIPRISRKSRQPFLALSNKNAEYVIEGQRIKLADGLREAETSPGSASRIVTRYFGNELKTDLNGDGREDVVFLLTQQRGGSGTFFYAVAALNTTAGYLGSDGYLLGDRIAPQTTVVSRNPRHKNVIVVNYGDRRPDEPMTAQPSVGKSVDPEARCRNRALGYRRFGF